MHYPDPYSPHPPGGPYHERTFDRVVDGIYELLRRLDQGLVDIAHVLRGKDNGSYKQDTLNFWLFWQHHPQSERWKCLGQRYWSLAAWQAWRTRFLAMPTSQRFNRSDGFPAEATLPKPARLPPAQRGDALVSEHVVPKKVLQHLLLRVPERDDIEKVLRLNLCCVVTRDENARLPTARHPDAGRPVERICPWNRYRDKGIVLLDNPSWTEAERAAVMEAGLLGGQRPGLPMRRVTAAASHGSHRAAWPPDRRAAPTKRRRRALPAGCGADSPITGSGEEGTHVQCNAECNARTGRDAFFASFEEFVEQIVMPLQAARPEWFRFDGVKTGGNRRPVGYFVFDGHTWRVHADSWLRPFILAYQARKQSTPSPALVVERTRDGRTCLALHPELRSWSPYKHFYVYHYAAAQIYTANSTQI